MAFSKVALRACLLVALSAICLAAAPSGQDQPPSEGSTLGQRIQIPEPCASVAKWISQILASGSYLQFVSYQPDLGLLTYKTLFSASDPDPVSPMDVTDFNKKRDKTVNITGLVFTLRSLVSSTITFEDAPSKAATASCTISAAFKYASKKGRILTSSGAAEKELLGTVMKRYAEHGLDY